MDYPHFKTDEEAASAIAEFAEATAGLFPRTKVGDQSRSQLLPVTSGAPALKLLEGANRV